MVRTAHPTTHNQRLCERSEAIPRVPRLFCGTDGSIQQTGIATLLSVIPGILPSTFQAAFHAFKIVPDIFVSQ
jgi:hypothetical protein